MYKHVISESNSGYKTYVNLTNSSAGRYLSRQPYVMNLVKEVLDSTELGDLTITIEYDMGRIIGKTDIIETSEKDSIFYAKAHKQSVYSRYAKNRYPSPSPTLTMILIKDTDGCYELTDTWIGPHSPPFPGDENETESSKSFWEDHALAQDAQVVQSKTITKICPY